MEGLSRNHAACWRSRFGPSVGAGNCCGILKSAALSTAPEAVVTVREGNHYPTRLPLWSGFQRPKRPKNKPPTDQATAPVMASQVSARSVCMACSGRASTRPQTAARNRMAISTGRSVHPLGRRASPRSPWIVFSLSGHADRKACCRLIATSGWMFSKKTGTEAGLKHARTCYAQGRRRSRRRSGSN